MTLSRTIDQMVDGARRCAGVQGTSALERHPDADLFDYCNRGIAALYRILAIADSGQRYLASTTLTTSANTEVYALPSDFMHMVSLSGQINGVQRWYTPYEMQERPHLVDQNAGWTGEPLYYRLRGSNISLLPVPKGVYSLTLWYSPAPGTLTTGQTFDTIARLDEYVVWWAAKEIAKKDRNWELHDRLSSDLAKLESQVDAIARNRDQNHGNRIQDVTPRDRFGRLVMGRGRTR